MRSTPRAPEAPEEIWWGPAADAWRMGWEEGFTAALRSVTTEQMDFPTEDPW